MREFTTTREETDTIEDASISQALLDSAQGRKEVVEGSGRTLRQDAEDFAGSQGKATVGEAR